MDQSVVLRACLLLLLEREPDYGYGLRARMTECFGWAGGDMAFTYRVLRQMEDEGLLRSTWKDSPLGPRRRSYSVTAKGRRLSKKLDTMIDFMCVVMENYRAMRLGRPGDSATSGPRATA